jgi:hypothetical protein
LTVRNPQRCGCCFLSALVRPRRHEIPPRQVRIDPPWLANSGQ